MLYEVITSNDPLVLVAGHRTWATAGATVAAITRFPREGRNGYRYGTETNAALAADWSPRPAWGFGGEFRVRTAAGDRYLGLARPNTGGSRLMFAPRARATLYGTGLAMEAALLWPFAQHLNGLQIGVDRTARLSYNFV